MIQGYASNNLQDQTTYKRSQTEYLSNQKYGNTLQTQQYQQLQPMSRNTQQYQPPFILQKNLLLSSSKKSQHEKTEIDLNKKEKENNEKIEIIVQSQQNNFNQEERPSQRLTDLYGMLEAQIKDIKKQQNNYKPKSETRNGSFCGICNLTRSSKQNEHKLHNEKNIVPPQSENNLLTSYNQNELFLSQKPLVTSQIFQQEDQLNLNSSSSLQNESESHFQKNNKTKQSLF